MRHTSSSTTHHADELEQKLFRPAQLAYGRAKRTHTDFAGRHGLASRKFETPSAGLASIGAKGFIDNAVVAVGRADTTLASLQDSLLPVEVGDPELRASLAELRDLVGGFSEGSSRAGANDRALVERSIVPR